MGQKTSTHLLRAIAATVAMFAATAVVPSAASARTVICKYGEHIDDTSGGMPAGRLRAINLPRRIDGVASRCLVAETVALTVATEVLESSGKLPRSVDVFGEDWDAGRFECKYKQKQGDPNPYMAASCRSREKKWRRVTFEMYS